MQGRAEISLDRQYRYALWRIWDTHKPRILFIGLNPSTADAQHDDPTLRRCVQFAQNWKKYGGLCMANLFAYRATQPRRLKSVANPVGPENDQWVWRLSRESKRVVAAWGNAGQWKQRSSVVRSMVKEMYCLGVTKSGEPRHPLYLPGDTPLVRYTP